MAKRTAREKLIEAANTLMLSKGYPATTVDEICDAAGVSKGSFYHAFQTKEELGLAVLDAFTERNARLVASGPQAAIADPADRALALIDHLVDIAGDLWGSGCLLGNFALDLADTNPAIGRAVSEKFQRVREDLALGMSPLCASGGVPDRWSPEELAEQFIVAAEGGLILAKAHGDWSYVTRALERFRQTVHRTARISA